MDSLVTVTGPASGPTAFDLTTLADVKVDLGIAGPAEDATLARYISESSLQLAHACNRVFAQETLSEQFRLDEAKPVLVLARRPAAITSISEDDAAPLTNADWEMDGNGGLLYRLEDDRRIAWTASKVVVAYSAGFDLPGGAPSDLQKAARTLVRAQWLAKGRDPLVRSESVPGVYEVAYWVGSLPGGAAWPAEIESVIAAYRDIPV
jgi:hypothetical protein